MKDFIISFLANLAADGILAIVLYYIITQPGEKKKERELELAILGHIKAELVLNETRAITYLRELDQIITAIWSEKDDNEKMKIAEYFPLRFTRGAWNAMREGGYISNINHPILAYSLFRVNELIIVANRSLRRFELIFLGNEDGDPIIFANIAKKDVEKLHKELANLLPKMQDVPMADVISNPLFQPENEIDIDRDQE